MGLMELKEPMGPIVPGRCQQVVASGGRFGSKSLLLLANVLLVYEVTLLGYNRWVGSLFIWVVWGLGSPRRSLVLSPDIWLGLGCSRLPSLMPPASLWSEQGIQEGLPAA